MDSANSHRLPILLVGYLVQCARVKLISSSNIGTLLVFLALQLGCLQAMSTNSSEFVAACQ